MTSCMIPLASSEVVQYNGYSPTKVPHILDFQGITRNTDEIKGHARSVRASCQWQIDHVSYVRFQSISFLLSMVLRY